MAYNKDSIVDYLKSNKQAADFRSRQHLWAMLDPREIYTGSFEQNKQLLESMRIGEYSHKSPKLDFFDKKINFGEDIFAVVISDSNVKIESTLSVTSIEVIPSQKVNLFKVNKDQFGLFPIHLMDNNNLSTSGYFALLPDNDKVFARWLPVANANYNKRRSIEFPFSMQDKLVDFIDHIYENQAKYTSEAFEKIDVLGKENLPGLLFDAAVSIGIISVSLFNAPLGGALALDFFFPMATKYLFKFFGYFLEAAIADLPDDWPVEEKRKLELFLVDIPSLASLPFSFILGNKISAKINRGAKKEYENICETIKTMKKINETAAWIFSEKKLIDNEKVRNVATIVTSKIGSSVSSISMICLTEKNKNK